MGEIDEVLAFPCVLIGGKDWTLGSLESSEVVGLVYSEISEFALASHRPESTRATQMS